MKKRKSYGSAVWWLERHEVLLQRYIDNFYPPEDEWVIKQFFEENPIQARVILEDFNLSNLEKQGEIIEDLSYGKSKIAVICGARGGGKTSLCMFLAEQLHYKDERQKIYLVGEDINKEIFPEWFEIVERIEQVPSESIAIVDESSITFSARNFYKEANILLTSLLATARHHNLTILFLTQHLSLIDVNIFRLRDLIFFVKSSDYNLQDRGSATNTKVHQFWNKVRNMMSPRIIGECLYECPSHKRFINFKYPLPTFWAEKISKLFKDYNFGEKLTEMKKKKYESEEKQHQIKVRRLKELTEAKGKEFEEEIPMP